MRCSFPVWRREGKRMGRRTVSLEEYPRRDHFLHFLQMAQPMVGLTVKVEITDWDERRRKAGAPFFLSFLYAAMAAVNAVPAFRQRIVDGGIVEYDYCDPSYTVAKEDGTYRYCLVHPEKPFPEYLEEGRRKQEEALREDHLVEEGDVLGEIFVSCLPWTSYDEVMLPYPGGDFSIPSLTFGKVRAEKVLALEDGKVTEREKRSIPVTVMAHHGLVDGIHLSRFYENLERELAEMF